MFDNIFFVFIIVGIITYVIFKAVSFIAALRMKKFTEKIIKEKIEEFEKEDKNASK